MHTHNLVMQTLFKTKGDVRKTTFNTRGTTQKLAEKTAEQNLIHFRNESR